MKNLELIKTTYDYILHNKAKYVYIELYKTEPTSIYFSNGKEHERSIWTFKDFQKIPILNNWIPFLLIENYLSKNYILFKVI